MHNWIPLPPDLENSAWDFVYQQLRFNPPQTPRIQPLMQCHALDLSWVMAAAFDAHREQQILALAQKILIKAGQGRPWIALDWQHECFTFDPAQQMPLDDFGEWPIPFIPNGDHVFFMLDDFSMGWFGDGMTHVLHLWGEPLIRCFENVGWGG